MSNKRPNPEKLIYIPDTIQNGEERVYQEQELNFKNWKRSSNILRKEEKIYRRN